MSESPLTRAFLRVYGDGMDIWQTLWDWLSIPSISSLIGILGILFGLASIIFTRKISRISSHLEFKSLIGGFNSELPQNISITYDDVPVEKVSSSVFIIWNSGNKVIDGSSLKTIDPLRVEARDGIKILRHNIQKTNNPTSNIEIYENPNNSGSLLIGFDFLEKKNGLRVEVLHTGNKKSLSVKGKLKGVKHSYREKANNYIPSDFIIKNKSFIKSYFPVAMKTAAILVVVSLMAILIHTFVQPEFFLRERPRTEHFDLWAVRTTIFVYLLILLFIYYKVRPPYPSKLRADINDADS